MEAERPFLPQSIHHVVLQYLPYEKYPDSEIKLAFPLDYLLWRMPQVVSTGQSTLVNGKLHSLDDRPASSQPGRAGWFQNGKLHRVGGPAIIIGTYQEWYQDGLRHRLDGPAVVDGACQEWYRDGVPHRLDGPALIKGDCREWYLDGQLHRLDGPAVVNAFGEYWYLNGQRHREHGPAVIQGGHLEWWIYGKQQRTNNRW